MGGNNDNEIDLLVDSSRVTLARVYTVTARDF